MWSSVLKRKVSPSAEKDSTESDKELSMSQQNLLQKRKSSANSTEMVTVVKGSRKRKSKESGFVEQVLTFDQEDGGEICSIVDSPMRMLQLAAGGNLEELRRVYSAHPERLALEDSKGAQAIHHAAGRNRVNVIEFVLEHGGDINARDMAGNTPLHWAAENNHVKAIDFLIENGADTTILNLRNHAPLHWAILSDCEDAVEAICKHPGVDVNISGELGQTPIHYCAVKDNLDVARKLLEFKPRLCIKDNNGVYPVHCAATNASAKVLKLLLDEVEKLGYTREIVLNFVDKERNSPIHSAVNSGDMAAVKLCLENGARIDVQQSDKSTPVHLACSQGALDMIKLMFTMQDESKRSLSVTDVEQMTPLHKAAMFDHPHVVDYLIGQGAAVDPVDKNLRTPLLIATAKGGWRTVKALLGRGADYQTRDKHKRNLLHMAIICGGSLSHFGEDFFQNPNAIELMNQKDACGCTPLHYASRQGNIKSLQGLLELGATINCKNDWKESPLHFAARYGRFHTCRRLLDSSMGPHIINDTEGEGLTALHLASLNGHAKVVQLLMTRGALLHRDHNGRTPFHLAAIAGYTNTMKVLLGTHGHLLDQVDDEGNTALHLAAKESHANGVKYLLTQDAQLLSNGDKCSAFDICIRSNFKDVALAFIQHDRWQEVMSAFSPKMGCPFIALIEHLPEVAMAVLDRCQTTADCDTKSQNYWINYDFSYLQAPIGTVNPADGSIVEPLIALNAMVRFNRVDILSHSVCLNYLAMKWSAYGRPFHLLNIAVYLVYLAFLTYFIACTDPKLIGSSLNGTIDYSQDIHTSPSTFTTAQIICLWVISILTGFNVFKELVQMIQQKLKYFLDFTNLVEWTIYGSTLAFILPYLLGTSYHFQWEFGAIAVFLAWFNFLVYLQRFDLFGIYVVMFLEILKTLVRVLLVFSILFIGFGMAFYILMSQEENEANSTPGLSIYRMVIMMLGEIDYMASYIEPATDDRPETMHYRTVTFVMLFVFILLMPILLINLLIGLAVGDIAGVQRNAQLKRLAMQVELHTELEQKLPTRLLKMVDKDHLKVSPNCTQNIICKVWEGLSESDNDFGDGSALDPVYGHLQLELSKQKRRMKDMSVQLDKQYELLRLIVQKMEIRSEDDEQDEGDVTVCGEMPHYKMTGLSGVVSQTMQAKTAKEKFSKVARFAKRITSGSKTPEAGGKS